MNALEAVRIRNPVASGDDACFGTDPETSREFRKVIVDTEFMRGITLDDTHQYINILNNMAQ